MPILSIVANPEGNSQNLQECSNAIVQRIEHEQQQHPRAWSSLAFYQVEFTAEVAAAVIELLRHTDSHSHCTPTSKLGDKPKSVHHGTEICFYQCPRNEHLNRVLFQAMKTNMFQTLTIQEHHRNQSLSSFPAFRMFEIISLNLPLARNLTKLRLCGTTMSAGEASKLRRGLEDSEFLHQCSEVQRLSDSCPLQQLFLSNNRFAPGGVEELCLGFVGNKSLRELSLVSCGLEDSQIAQIATALEGHPGLTHLRLSWNRCREKGLQALARLIWFLDGSARLESLDLQHQSVRHHGIGGVMNQHCSNDRMQLSPLWEAWKNQIENFPDDSLNDGYRLINHSLKRLVLSGNGLVDEDMVSLAALLPQWSSLEELDLDSNQITSTGLWLLTLPEPLQDVLERDSTTGIASLRQMRYQRDTGVMSRLRTLRLSLNPLANKGSPQETLARLLRKHPELHAVQTTNPDVWRRFDDEDSMLEHLMGINKAGRCLLLQHKPESLPMGGSASRLRRPAPPGIWPLVLARIKTAVRRGHREDAMFFLLRNGPVLLEHDATSSCHGSKRALGGHWSSPVVLKRRRRENP